MKLTMGWTMDRMWCKSKREWDIFLVIHNRWVVHHSHLNLWLGTIFSGNPRSWRPSSLFCKLISHERDKNVYVYINSAQKDIFCGKKSWISKYPANSSTVTSGSDRAWCEQFCVTSEDFWFWSFSLDSFSRLSVLDSFGSGPVFVLQEFVKGRGQFFCSSTAVLVGVRCFFCSFLLFRKREKINKLIDPFN